MKYVIRFRKIWIWVFLIGFVLFLLSSNSGLKPTWNPVEQLIIEIASPFQKFIKKTADIIEKFWSGYFHLVNVHKDNRKLKKEIQSLKAESFRFRELLASHNRLQKLLKFKHTINRPVLAAQVIGLDPTGWFKSIIIDKGRGAGVKLNMAVVDARGVVGRIVSVSPNYAKALLVIDQNSAVDCLVQRSRARGMVKGLSTEICNLDYVVKSSDVAVGDMIVTSGLGGVFPKGLSMGKVVKIKGANGGLFKDIEIKPSVDFSKLEEVLVILKHQRSKLSNRRKIRK